MSEIPQPWPAPEPPQSWADRLAQTVTRPAVKFALLATLVLLMLIPSTMESGLVADRQSRQAEVEAGFRANWGPSQSILGPLLVVPYVSAGNRRYLVMAPSRLGVTAELTPEVRRRGFFSAVVYAADIHLDASFAATPLPATAPSGIEPLWAESRVVVGAKELRAMHADPSLDWNGTKVDFTDTTDGTCGLVLAGAPVPLDGPPTADRPVIIKTNLDLRGSGSFDVVPVAGQTRLDVSAPWHAPGFTGSALPLRSEINPAGFRAAWDMSGPMGSSRVHLATSPDDCLLGQTSEDFAAAQAGVTLVQAMSTYHAVERTSKYTVLFLTLSFLTYSLFETLSGVPISVVRYALLGFSVSLFALLLVSLAEPLGFTVGYAISAALVSLQGALFTASVTRRVRLAVIFIVVQAIMFVALYIIINLETYALLAGSGLLFVALSTVMAATRHLNLGGTAPGET